MIYTFICKECSSEFDIRKPVLEIQNAQIVCPVCGGDTRRKYSPVAAQYKAAGFFTSDNRKEKSEVE